MPYCPRCGVELDPSTRACPLCQAPIPRFDDLGPGEPAWPSPAGTPSSDPSKPYATSRQRRNRAFQGVAAVLTTAAVIVTAVDVFSSSGVTWSRYPAAAFAAAFGFTGSALLWHRRPWIWATAWLVLTLALLAALDGLHNGRFAWFPSLGLPVVVATFGLAAAGAVWINRSRRRGYNLFGVIFALIGVELLAVDALVQNWMTGHPGWSWSVVAALVLGPLAILFGILHRAVTRTPDLRRTFHF